MKSSTSSLDEKDDKPQYFNLISKEDQGKYWNLRSTLSSHICRNRRGKRLETFAEMLNAIQIFCIRGDSDDWKRCLVCGVCWIPNGIAINTRQLGLLIDKCKSSINGSLQKMGYTTLQSRSESSAPLIEAIPALKSNFAELRQWTVRLFLTQTPQPGMSTYTISKGYPFSSPVPQRTSFYGELINSQNYPAYTNEQQLSSFSAANMIAPATFISPPPQVFQQQEMMEMRALQNISQHPMVSIQPNRPSMGMQSSIMPLSQIPPVIQHPVSQYSTLMPPTINMKSSNGNSETIIPSKPNHLQLSIDNEESSPETHTMQSDIYKNESSQLDTNFKTNSPETGIENEHDSTESQQAQADNDFYNDPFALTPSFLMNEEENLDSPPPDDPFDIAF